MKHIIFVTVCVIDLRGIVLLTSMFGILVFIVEQIAAKWSFALHWYVNQQSHETEQNVSLSLSEMMSFKLEGRSEQHTNTDYSSCEHDNVCIVHPVLLKWAIGNWQLSIHFMVYLALENGPVSFRFTNQIRHHFWYYNDD